MNEKELLFAKTKAFNSHFTIDTKILGIDDFGNEFIDTIKSEVYYLGNGTNKYPVIYLANKGVYDFERIVTVLPEAKHE